MRAEGTIRKELRKVELALRLRDEMTVDEAYENQKDHLYGAQQALAWVLRRDAMSPYRAFSDSRSHESA